MTEIDLVKAPDGLRGWSERDQAAYRRYRQRIAKLEVGECIRVGYVFPRNAKFHRKFFAMLNVGFDAWDPMKERQRNTYKGVTIAKDFDQFREDVTILAGFKEAYFDLKTNRMRVKAQSIAWAKMDDLKFERLYSAVANVLIELFLGAQGYDRSELDRVVERIMEFTQGSTA